MKHNKRRKHDKKVSFQSTFKATKNAQKGEIFYSLTSFVHLQGYTEEEATARAIFESLDKNGDGSLAEEEYIKVGNSLVLRQNSGFYNCLFSVGLLGRRRASGSAERWSRWCSVRES